MLVKFLLGMLSLAEERGAICALTGYQCPISMFVLNTCPPVGTWSISSLLSAINLLMRWFATFLSVGVVTPSLSRRSLMVLREGEWMECSKKA
jgi:hypothetical protein